MGIFSNKVKKQRKKSVFREYAEALITALILALIIRAVAIQAFKIPSGSMKPTLLVGDHILVNKLIYGFKIPFMDKRVLVFRNPKLGDIIVFKYPKDPSKNFIKRVIATEGDVVEIRDKVVYVNNIALDEPYTQHTDSIILPRVVSRDNYGPEHVPRNKIFVLGDNRDNSRDSRYWGFVDISSVAGKTLIKYWSWDNERHWPRFNRIGRLIE